MQDAARKRAAERGIIIGSFPAGPRNLISDVPGITVGHCTIRRGSSNTGVTVILPCAGNPYAAPLTAADFVWNGFGKTAGLVQMDELGTLESPIALTSTLNVGRIQDALVDYMLMCCRKDGIRLATFNPVVGECNDSGLNDVTVRPAGLPELLQAVQTASEDFPMGDVGAGAGTQCHGLKGGIGSASRRLMIGRDTYTVGMLVQSNHGCLEDLCIGADRIGTRIARQIHAEKESDKGSIMMILATDVPLDSRQIRRVLKRAANGLARIGSRTGHGSGEIMIGFTTAGRTARNDPHPFVQKTILKEELLEDLFRAAAECCEEAVLDSMLMAAPAVFPDGRILHCLSEFL